MRRARCFAAAASTASGAADSSRCCPLPKYCLQPRAPSAVASHWPACLPSCLQVSELAGLVYAAEASGAVDLQAAETAAHSALRAVAVAVLAAQTATAYVSLGWPTAQTRQAPILAAARTGGAAAYRSPTSHLPPSSVPPARTASWLVYRFLHWPGRPTAATPVGEGAGCQDDAGRHMPGDVCGGGRG